MIWREVEEKYGKKIADKMKKSQYLNGVTCGMKNGEIDWYDSDLDLAYRDVTGKYIHPEEWD
jgi:hypothetical protein